MIKRFTGLTIGSGHRPSAYAHNQPTTKGLRGLTLLLKLIKTMQIYANLSCDSSLTDSSLMRLPLFCSNVLLFFCFSVLLFLCSSVPMFFCSTVSLILFVVPLRFCSRFNLSLLLRFFCRSVLFYFAFCFALLRF